VSCITEKKVVYGLEQGRSGYGFRAVTPAYHKGQFIGCVEMGSDLDGCFSIRRMRGPASFFAHGAGAGMAHPFMNAVAAGLFERCWAGVRRSRGGAGGGVDR
jgi:hypothetical protein